METEWIGQRQWRSLKLEAVYKQIKQTAASTSVTLENSLQLSYAIGDSRPPSRVLIEFEPVQIFLACHEEFSLVFPTLTEN